MQGQIQLSENYSMDARQYAILKTAILGLPDSGKSYTAMKITEGLLDNHIPIVVIDPVGIWHGLKQGKKGKPGYDIIVAGGSHADIDLTEQNAGKIMEAAMKNNIPIIFDIFHRDFKKKVTQKNILLSILEVLLYDNKDYGLRHIIIEEAGEYAPQVIKPQMAHVYSMIESLTTMGRNMYLGATYINQRAAQLNKAILENCNRTILHAQMGSNSLKSIRDWLNRMEVEAGEVLNSIPRLHKGECWVLKQQEEPVKIKVAERKTIHPDPLKPEKAMAKAPSIDVKKFVSIITEQLKKEEQKPIQEKTKPSTPAVTVNADALQEKDNEIIRLKKLLFEANEKLYSREIQLKSAHEELQIVADQLEKVISRAVTSAHDIRQKLQAPVEAPESTAVKDHPIKARTPAVVREGKIEQPLNKPQVYGSDSGMIRMLAAAKRFYPNPISLPQMAQLSDLLPGGRTIKDYYRALRKDNKFIVNGDLFTITELGLKDVKDAPGKPRNKQERLELWVHAIGSDSGASRMLRFLYNSYPEGANTQRLAQEAALDQEGRTFKDYYRQLRRLGLINISKDWFTASDYLCK